MKALLFSALVTAVTTITYAQDRFSVRGVVVDEDKEPLPGAYIHLEDQSTISDDEGRFTFIQAPPGPRRLTCSYVGYTPFDTLLNVSANLDLYIKLQPEITNLNEIIIEDEAPDKLHGLKTEKADREFLMKNYSGSLIKSLESIAGLNSMDIGVASSKPVLRGLGFNRVVVTENKIKQEGQQWGADHGLEIDPFHIEEVEIIKGAASIEYGSDAIGGVINLDNSDIPEKGFWGGDLSLLAKSVNQTMGGSLNLQGRKDRFYFKARGTALDFGDYHIPANEIVYLTTNIPVYNNRLKNTAGKEKDLNMNLGYLSPTLRSSLSVSNVAQRSGFFPGSHGIPDIDRVKDDGDSRNIAFPYQKTNHFKIITNNILYFGESDLHIDASLQNNRRQEWSEFHTHYSGQQIPEVDPDLELDFKLTTFTLNAKYHFDLSPSLHVDLGAQGQFQNNLVGGYNFFLPAYKRKTIGFFAKSSWDVNEKLEMSGGARYDLGFMKIDGYYDPVLKAYLDDKDSLAEQHAWRSRPSENYYGDFSGLFGLLYRLNPHVQIRMNIGKSFRLPAAVELGANGVHHGSFRHEKGQPSLSPERGYYIDGSFEAGWEKFSFSLSPYLFYFSNYIFLNPSGQWSVLPHAGQEYRYSESEALHSGIEIAVQHSFSRFTWTANFESIYNSQLTGSASKNYPFPFTPPPNIYWEVEYNPGIKSRALSDPGFFVTGKFAFAQNRIARNEKATPGYSLFGLGVQSGIKLLGVEADVTLQAQNILNIAYFNHISFYRQLEIPEPGRNIQLMIKIPFAF